MTETYWDHQQNEGWSAVKDSFPPSNVWGGPVNVLISNSGGTISSSGQDPCDLKSDGFNEPTWVISYHQKNMEMDMDQNYEPPKVDAK